MSRARSVLHEGHLSGESSRMYPAVQLDAAGAGVVSQAGAVALTETQPTRSCSRQWSQPTTRSACPSTPGSMVRPDGICPSAALTRTGGNGGTAPTELGTERISPTKRAGVREQPARVTWEEPGTQVWGPVHAGHHRRRPPDGHVRPSRTRPGGAGRQADAGAIPAWAAVRGPGGATRCQLSRCSERTRRPGRYGRAHENPSLAHRGRPGDSRHRVKRRV